MVDENKEQSQERKTAAVLKEVFQDIGEDHTDSDSQASTEEIAEQIKGSDADTDQVTGKIDQTSTEEAAEQVKGSDADRDQ